MLYRPTDGTEKFFRAFDKKIPVAPPFSRLIPWGESGIAGRRKGERFFLYYRKKGVFSLFSTTLYGSVSQTEKGALRLFVSRPRGTRLLLLLWSGALFWAGGSLVLSEFFFSLSFLLPGAAVLIFALCPNKKKKALLLEEISSLG